MKGIMKRRKVPKYKENPFIKDVAEHTQIGYKKIASKDNSALVVMNKETGELQGAAGIWYKEEVERNQFVKLYSDGVAAILGLKSPGKKVFRLVYNQLYGVEGKNKTEIILNYDMLSEDEQKLLSRSTFERGISELIKANLSLRIRCYLLFYKSKLHFQWQQNSHCQRIYLEKKTSSNRRLAIKGGG